MWIPLKKMETNHLLYMEDLKEPKRDGIDNEPGKNLSEDIGMEFVPQKFAVLVLR